MVDDNTDYEFLKLVKQQFRGLQPSLWPGLPMVEKVSLRDSVADEMLKLADMVGGAACQLYRW